MNNENCSQTLQGKDPLISPPPTLRSSTNRAQARGGERAAESEEEPEPYGTVRVKRKKALPNTKGTSQLDQLPE